MTKPSYITVFFGLRKLACALKAGAKLPHSKVPLTKRKRLLEKLYKNVNMV